LRCNQGNVFGSHSSKVALGALHQCLEIVHDIPLRLGM
jgi:hypothetical protein